MEGVMTGCATVADARSAREVLSWSRRLVEPALREAVDALPVSTRRIAGYHFGWWDADGRPAGGYPGKGLRPALVLLSAQAVGGEAMAALPGAVAVELVHNFSLIHDDLIDGDLSRRHRPTSWTVFGSGPAIVAGDALLALAFDVLVGDDHPAAGRLCRMLSLAVLELAEGEHADLSFECRTDVDLPESVTMAEGKTGALLGCACALGAGLGGGSETQVALLRRFGEQLGVAFQLVDDLLGIWGDPASTGKPVRADLHRRKKSLPVVAAISSGTQAGEELAALYKREVPLSDAELGRAVELIDRAGGRAWCQARVEDLIAGALRQLYTAVGATRVATELTALARLAGHRDH
jgi:geranylgeranyl diphosphate synthase type I